MRGVVIAVENLQPGDEILPSKAEVVSVERDANGNYEVRTVDGIRSTVRPGTQYLCS